ncbi:MAG: hypothetical protein LC667_06260 [Thioalkalivibrio sp.]|nr:hypothetical protein [Thioalkalivibrio sp.]
MNDVISRYGIDGGEEPDRILEPLSVGPGKNVQVTDGLLLDGALVDDSAGLQSLLTQAGPGQALRVQRISRDKIQISSSFEQGSPGGPMMRGSATRSYKRRGADYALQRIELAMESGVGEAVARTFQTQDITIRRVHRNPAKDRMRHERRQASGGYPTIQLIDTMICMESLDGCDSGGTQPPPPPDTTSNPCTPVAGAQKVLLVHGIFSDGSTWGRMDNWVRCNFEVDGPMRPSLDWVDPLNQQRDELRGLVPSSAADMVVIGHSNGGLVSRAYAQWTQTYQPGKVAGVITLDSPNQGAIIAMYANGVHAMISPLSYILSSPEWGSLLEWYPFYMDDLPWSSFLADLNDYNETFINVGVRTHTPKRWVIWRILGADGYYPESPYGERAAARRAQETYDRYRHCASTWWKWLYGEGQYCSAQMAARNALDYTWHMVTAPDPIPSDGFIHGSGQVYPGALRTPLIAGGDSHVSTVRSPLVWEIVDQALREDMGVAPPSQ